MIIWLDGTRNRIIALSEMTSSHLSSGEVSSTMKLIDRARQRRLINRQTRAIDRAMLSAPTQSMRDEIAVFAQRKVF
jgi:hypothetical protein